MSTALVDLYSYNNIDRAAAFESSTSFASIPLQPIPQNLINNSGPISSIRNRVVLVKDQDWIVGGDSKVQNHNEQLIVSSANFSSEGSLEDDESSASQNLQWAQGKAGEDRVHVVVSEEDGWVFVGIYDGFNDPCNGPDAPDYLLSNLYTAVHKELKGLIWDERLESAAVTAPATSPAQPEKPDSGRNLVSADGCAQCVVDENYPCASGDVNFDSNSKKREFRNSKTKSRGGSGRKWEDNQRRWRCEWDRERVELDRRLKELLNFEILRWSKI